MSSETLSTSPEPDADLAVVDPRYAALVGLVRPVLGAKATAFVEGGLAATGGIGDGRAWFQLQLALDGHRDEAAYRNMLALAREFRSDPRVNRFFFMHKPPGTRTVPPGIRMRFRTLAQRSGVAAAAASAFAAAAGVEVRAVAVYEPECSLFGGPAAMDVVHGVFEADSLLWLAHFAAPGRAPAWRLALATTDRLLRALDITGAEDLDVWAWIRDRGGRSLCDPTVAEARMSAEVADRWGRRRTLTDDLDDEQLALVEAWTAKVGTVVPASVFGRGLATVGPREAAALMTIFAWNRALLTMGAQATIATVLSRRDTTL